MKSLVRKFLPDSSVTLYRGRRPAIDFLFTSSKKIGLVDKLKILRRFEAINTHIECEHAEPEIFRVINKLIETDEAAVEGCIVECGAYQGGSTCKLSIVARYLGRKLLTFDSFEGLPETQVYSGNWGGKITFRKGDYASDYDQFAAQLRRYGEPDVTTLTKGWFHNTLPGFDRKIALLLVDVDLVSSTQTCLKHLWPCMAQGGCMFSHDGHVDDIQALFANQDYWTREVGSEPPTFVGLGTEKLVYARKPHLSTARGGAAA